MLEKLRKAGAVPHSLLILADAAEGESLADSQRTVDIEVEAEQALVLGFELKQFFGANFAVAPKVYVDVTDQILGIEVPLYILQDKKGGLTGGVTPGWRSDTKAFTASAFVGPVLTLITKN